MREVIGRIELAINQPVDTPQEKEEKDKPSKKKKKKKAKVSLLWQFSNVLHIKQSECIRWNCRTIHQARTTRKESEARNESERRKRLRKCQPANLVQTLRMMTR